MRGMTCVFRAVASLRSAGHGRLRLGRTHFVRSLDRGRCWTLCGRLLTPDRSRLSRPLSPDEVDCTTCREANLEERRRLRPGWWGRG